MANAGSELKFVVLGSSVSRRSRCSFRRAHSWACDEPCELNILESEKVDKAFAVLERCSKESTWLEKNPAVINLLMKNDGGASPLALEEDPSTKDGSGTDNEQSSAENQVVQPWWQSEAGITLWPDTDSEDGFCASTWNLRHGSKSSESESTPHTAEVGEDLVSFEGTTVHDTLTRPSTPESEAPPSTSIKVRSGMVIEELTSLMIRNLPTNLQQDRLVLELDKAGFAGLYDFCHLPVWTASGTRKGYAFVNMIDTAAAEKLSAVWHKTRQPCLGMRTDDQALDIVAANVQGLEANLAMLSEPRKRRGGKSARSAKGKANSLRVQSANAKAPSPKAPRMPPGTFHETSAPVATAAVHSGEPSDAVTPSGGVLSILGFPAPPTTAGSPAGQGTGSSVKAMTMVCDAGMVSPCGRIASPPVVLSVNALGSIANRSAPR